MSSVSTFRIFLLVACLIGFLVTTVFGISQLGWRRFMTATVSGAVFAAMCGGVPLIVGILGGRTAAWASIPLVLAAACFGRTPLGLLNFLVLQWFGVRLQAEFDRDLWLHGVRGRWWASNAPRHGLISWSLLRWVWPLTGWWSPYRRILREVRQ